MTALALILASPAFADETRQLDAHVHGTGAVNIAIDGNEIALELRAPGADIVGFEYEATSLQDRASMSEAMAMLSRPAELFAVSSAAGCIETEMSVALETEDDHHDEGHNDHGHGDHGHDHEEHGHDDKAAAKHEDHDHDHGAEEHAHDDHDHAAAEASHTEFHATYMMDCADISAATDITFVYFEMFPGAEKLVGQIVSDAGATGFEVTRAAPVLELGG